MATVGRLSSGISQKTSKFLRSGRFISTFRNVRSINYVSTTCGCIAAGGLLLFAASKWRNYNTVYAYKPKVSANLTNLLLFALLYRAFIQGCYYYSFILKARGCSYLALTLIMGSLGATGLWYYVCCETAVRGQERSRALPALPPACACPICGTMSQWDGFISCQHYLYSLFHLIDLFVMLEHIKFRCVEDFFASECHLSPKFCHWRLYYSHHVLCADHVI